MGLTLIASPIGNADDITLRALNKLKNSPCIIGEEIRTLRRRLSEWDVAFKEKKLFTLNEHTDKTALDELLKVCTEDDVCFLSDCGTPSFFDPGFELVRLCKKNNVSVNSLPGVSSLSALFPFLPVKTQRFDVLGFPPQKEQERQKFFLGLKNNKVPFFILDTPYRFKKTLADILKHFPNSQIVLGINLTCENERVLQGSIKECLEKTKDINKENFVLMLYPEGFKQN